MKHKVLLVGAAVLAIGLGGAGLALAADSRPTVVTPVDGKPDLSKVTPGVAIPIGPVSPGSVTGGVTQAK